MPITFPKSPWVVFFCYDAVDFLIAYGKRFEVDISNFMAADYFNGEGLGLLSYIGAKLFGSKGERKPFTVNYLYKGSIAGRLDDKIINRLL